MRGCPACSFCSNINAPMLKRARVERYVQAAVIRSDAHFSGAIWMAWHFSAVDVV